MARNPIAMPCRRLFRQNKIIYPLVPSHTSKDVHENTDIEEIIQMAAAIGVDYDSYWSQMCAQVNTIQESCSPWREEDFMYLDASIFVVSQH